MPLADVTEQEQEKCAGCGKYHRCFLIGFPNSVPIKVAELCTEEVMEARDENTEY